MKELVIFWTILSILVLISVAPVGASEWFIFDDEVLHGALSDHDGGFEVSDDNPYAGDGCLARELVNGDWAWITGIGEGVPMNLDITGIEFDDAFIEFFIDSGEIPISYIELRLAGAGWNPDAQAVIQTDAVEGYEQIRILLTEFHVKQLGMAADDLDEFTGSSGMIDIWSVGFSPGGDFTLYVDEIRIADSDEPDPQRAVKPEGKLATLWAAVKSNL